MTAVYKKIDFAVYGAPQATVFLVEPQSEEARQHLNDVAPDDAQWFGGGIAVEHRYIDDFVAALRSDGFNVKY